MARDIKAGSAYVEMALKDDELIKGLARSREKIKDFAGALQTIGNGFLDAGRDVSDFINLSVASFAEFGTKLSGVNRKSSKEVKQLTKDLGSLDVAPTGEAVQAAKDLDTSMRQAKTSVSALNFEIGSVLRSSDKTSVL